MIKWCHRTLESVVKKVMEKQEDWYEILNSVLLGMRSQVHSSTGYSPIRMLFNKDPIMPFQLAGKNPPQCTIDGKGDILANHTNASIVSTEDIVHTVGSLEEQWQKIFSDTKKKY